MRKLSPLTKTGNSNHYTAGSDFTFKGDLPK